VHREANPTLQVYVESALTRHSANCRSTAPRPAPWLGRCASTTDHWPCVSRHAMAAVRTFCTLLTNVISVESDDWHW